MKIVYTKDVNSIGASILKLNGEQKCAIYQIIQTGYQGEIVMATSEGIIFGIISTQNSFDKTETLMKNKDVFRVLEINQSLLLVCVARDPKLKVLDRTSKKVLHEIPNPSGSPTIYQMMRITGYHSESNPIVFLRDQANVSVINVKYGLACTLVKNVQFNGRLSGSKMFMVKGEEGNMDIYTIVWELTNSWIKKYTLSKELRQAFKI